MATINYEYKAYVLREHNELIKRYKRAKLNEYCNDLYFNDGVITKTFLSENKESVNDLEFDCFLNGTFKELHEVQKIYNANIQRTKRLRKRIEKMLLTYSCLFITLTFNDETLSNTTSEQRRKAVVKYLKLFNAPYIANIDFGSQNQREHYHCLIGCDNIDLTKWRKYGNINVQRVRNRSINNDKTRLAKYICKLTNHAIKETTKRSCCIYSR